MTIKLQWPFVHREKAHRAIILKLEWYLVHDEPIDPPKTGPDIPPMDG